MCKFFIIESEIQVINSIKKIMEDFADFHCIGVSDSYDNAMNIILKDNPKLVLINIDNAINNPFQFVNDSILYSTSDVIFIAISNKKEKAYDAIKMGFHDFLLNPLSELEIRKSILNFQKKKLVKKRKCICLKSYKDYQYLNTDEILFLKADNNTTEFYMSDGTVVNAFKTLKSYLEQLPREFIRIHKSYIINKNFVSRIRYGKSICSISNHNHSIPFTKTYIENIENLNNSLSQFTHPFYNN